MYQIRHLKKYIKNIVVQNVRAVAISNQSTSLCKSLNFNFMPIWLSFIGEATILCSELLDNVGKFVKNSDNLRLILDSYFHNQILKKKFLSKKLNQQFILIRRYTKVMLKV